MKEKNKLSFNSIVFEITRKCNLKCEHCVKGAAQNITITKSIINKVLDSVGFCKSIYLTGGEPFLEIDIIEYLVDKIIEKNITVLSFSCVTNGTILNNRIVNLFEKINLHCRKNIDNLEILLGENIEKDNSIVAISISCDPFHEKADYKKALNFYKDKLKHTDISVELHEKEKWDIIDNGEVALSYDGRMAENFEKLGKPPCVCNSSRHRIEYEYDELKVIKCPIEIHANGNIGISTMESYKNADENKIGNIFIDTLNDMIERNIETEPFSCAECYRQLDCKRCMLEVGTTSPMTKIEKIQAKRAYKFMEKDRNIRIQLKKAFPEAPMKDITESVLMYMNYILKGQYIKALNDIYPDYSYTREQEKDVYKTIKTFMRLNKIKNVLDKIQVS